MWASGLKNMDNLGLSSKTRVQKMEENGHKIDTESLVEAELDLEIRGLLAGDERREQCIPIKWALRGPGLRP